ncbi:hypothetical protein DL98DRAFT_277782 [Cadophora sp. DSE1049]|nr:hypothetical protein DL98DRAFT_277782 [Cadophora sp. DSE1049]
MQARFGQFDIQYITHVIMAANWKMGERTNLSSHPTNLHRHMNQQETLFERSPNLLDDTPIYPMHLGTAGTIRKQGASGENGRSARRRGKNDSNVLTPIQYISPYPQRWISYRVTATGRLTTVTLYPVSTNATIRPHLLDAASQTDSMRASAPSLFTTDALVKFASTVPSSM